MIDFFSHPHAHLSAAQTHAFPGPDDITREQLDNGIIVLSRANNSSPSVVINGYLPAGGIFDPDDKLGLGDFTASALMRGTEKYNFYQIYDALESVGASLGISSGVNIISFTGRALAEDLPLLLNLLAEVMRRPIFPAEHVERLRAQLLTGLAIRAQDTGAMAGLMFDKIVYEGHPYSRPEEGYPETIAVITQNDLLEFHRRYYGPAGMVLAIVGAIDPAQAAQSVVQAFGDWQNPDKPHPPESPPVKVLQGVVKKHVTISGKSQSDIVLGAAGPSRHSPHYLATALGNSVLGQFGMMGRIGKAVRDKAGLAYYVHSSLSGGGGPGPWYVSAGVDPENVDRAIELILQEIKRFVGEPVGEDELNDSKAQFIGSLPLSLESNAGVAAALIILERFDLGLDYFGRYPDLIRAITPDEVLEVARHYLDPNCLGIATAGP